MRRLLIEARPGAGKTTALRRVADLLRARGVRVGGVLTDELRTGRQRVGFSVTALATGEQGTLAHVGLPSSVRVGRYGVDLEGFARIALPELCSEVDVMLIDEVGKMELACSPFRAAVHELFDGETPVAATVHAFRDPFTDALKARSDLELLRLTRENRDGLPRRIAELLLASAMND